MTLVCMNCYLKDGQKQNATEDEELSPSDSIQ